MYAIDTPLQDAIDWRAQYHLTSQELLAERQSADRLERTLYTYEREIERAHRQLDKLGIPRLSDGRRLDLNTRLYRLRRDLAKSPEATSNTCTALVPIAHYRALSF